MSVKLLCTKCHTVKDEEDFSNDSRRSSGKQSQCKQCKLEWAREYRRRCPEKARATQRRSAILRRYGITIHEYKDMCASQNWVCAICGETPKKRALHVDHDHKSGKVRRLLCMRCNSVIGYVKEDVKILQNMIKYLSSSSTEMGL